ncbi:MAG: DNA translocase FtsK, partial [Victivallales bacterium]|nr:DNA translocase FtsK [Victivallales bacterium]
PGVDVITGNIKANFPTRIAFKTTSQIDSRTILDGKGAESLLGRGDMIFKSNDGMDQRRIQCAMVTDQEIEHLVDFWAEQAAAPANFEIIKTAEPTEDVPVEEVDEGDDLMKRAITIIIEDKRPTVSYLQRRMGIGYNKAATLIETLEKYGIISPPDSQKRRQVLYSSVEEALSVIE